MNIGVSFDIIYEEFKTALNKKNAGLAENIIKMYPDFFDWKLANGSHIFFDWYFYCDTFMFNSILKIIVSFDIEIDCITKSSMSLMHYAILNDNIEGVKLLTRLYTTINNYNDPHYGPILIAAYRLKNDISHEIFKFLMNHYDNINYNETDFLGNTILHYIGETLAHYNYNKTIKFIIHIVKEFGDCEIKNNQGDTFIDLINDTDLQKKVYSELEYYFNADNNDADVDNDDEAYSTNANADDELEKLAMENLDSPIPVDSDNDESKYYPADTDMYGIPTLATPKTTPALVLMSQDDEIGKSINSLFDTDPKPMGHVSMPLLTYNDDWQRKIQYSPTRSYWQRKQNLNHNMHNMRNCYTKWHVIKEKTINEIEIEDVVEEFNIVKFTYFDKFMLKMKS